MKHSETVGNLKIISGKFDVVGICANGNHGQRWGTTFHKY
jgi:hypothetical protein